MVEVAEENNDADKTETKEVIHDHPMFKMVDDGNLEGVQNYLEVEGVSVELEDQHGMTPLMHACWKANPSVVRYDLISQHVGALKHSFNISFV